MQSIDELDPLDLTYAHLRALRLGEVEAWFWYVCGDPAKGTHVVQLAGNRYRTLHRGEPLPWVMGMADSAGHGNLVDELLEEPRPEMLTVEQAAARITPIDPRLGLRRRDGVGITLEGVKFLIQTGRLYSVSGPGRQRLVFGAQVDLNNVERLHAATARLAAEGDRVADEELPHVHTEVGRAREVWRRVRALLPDQVHPDTIAEDTRPAASPDPLPLAAGHGADRRMKALILGDSFHWFHYDRPVPGSPTGFQVRTPTGQRVVPGPWVLPWVLGCGDQRGAGSMIAYRDGLG